MMLFLQISCQYNLSPKSNLDICKNINQRSTIKKTMIYAISVDYKYLSNNAVGYLQSMLIFLFGRISAEVYAWDQQME